MYSRTRVKICGITTPADARIAVDAGADALGVVFYEPSPRYVTVATAAQIAAAVPPFVTVVGLFVDVGAARVQEVLERVPLGALQFHGDEDEAFCRQFGRPWLKAIRMRPGLDPAAVARAYPGACGLLLDAYRQGLPGGTGEVFEWDRARGDIHAHLVIAGGLDADNVGAAIGALAPHAVDVSGGVESAPGVKDPERIARFMAAVAAADHTRVAP